MRSSPSRSRKRAAATAIAAALVASPATALAQACCAGSSAITPGRLALHEDALVGIQTKSAIGFGSFDASGHYASLPSGNAELDLEQDLVAAYRVVPRGQLALLLPLVEARRATPTVPVETGGGFGDINLSGRYDFTLAGASSVVPGVALLLGVTLPTGRPPDSAKTTLAVDATGVGALQANVGVALEQAFGPWLVNATAIAAYRFPYTASGVHDALAPQLTLLAAAAYTFSNDDSLGLSLSYAIEGDATVDGVVTAGTERRTPVVSLTGGVPFGDAWRAFGGVYVNPPVSGLGANLPYADFGLTLTLLRTWS